MHIADLLIAEHQADETGDAAGELDEHYLAALGVTDRLGAWRTLAAEHVRAVG